MSERLRCSSAAQQGDTTAGPTAVAGLPGRCRIMSAGRHWLLLPRGPCPRTPIGRGAAPQQAAWLPSRCPSCPSALPGPRPPYSPRAHRCHLCATCASVPILPQPLLRPLYCTGGHQSASALLVIL